MNVIDVNGSDVSVIFTYEELRIVSRTLAEVDERLSIAEYATRMGAQRAEADRLLQDIRAARALQDGAPSRPSEVSK